MPEALLIGIVVGLTASVVTGLFAQGFIFRARSPTYIDGFVAAALTVSRIPSLFIRKCGNLKRWDCYRYTGLDGLTIEANHLR